MDSGGLLERERELSALEQALAEAMRGDGTLVIVGGPAGIGKTALLDAVRRLAGQKGLLPLAARCSDLERDHPYGVVRQLFEPPLRRLPGDEVTELFAGAAQLAAPLVAPPGALSPRSAKPSADASRAVLHGLYWLTTELATRQPLLILVDDLHWADAPSLRFLLHLARRVEGLATLLAVSVRPGESQANGALLSRLTSDPAAQALQPAALTQQAVAELIGDVLGQQPEEAFASACHAATGGTPFLVRELATALAADGIAPTAESAARVEEFGPGTVAHATLLRLTNLAPGAAPLVRAVAILGAQAELPLCHRLAELDEQEALRALDALIGAHVLRAERPLRFIHPLVRAAVYESLPAGARSGLHARAAEVLAAQDAGLDAVAGHLLKTEPAGRAEVIEQLRRAAREAMERGAPDNAVSYLNRALEEGGPQPLRARLLHELGRAGAQLRRPSAIEHLREAYALSDEPLQRAQVAAELAEMLAFAGQWGACRELVGSAIADTGERDRPLRLRLESIWVITAAYDPRRVAEYDRRLPELRAAAEQGGAEGRPLNLVLAGVGAARGADLDELISLVERGLDGGRFLAEEGSESWALAQAFGPLIVLEELDRAAALADEVIDDGRARGSVLGYVAGLAHRAWANTRRGDLVAAEADLRPAIELALEHGLMPTLPATLTYGLDALVERPGLRDLAAIADSFELEPALSSILTGAQLLAVRGRLRMVAGDSAGAADDLRKCVRTAEATGSRYGWGPGAAALWLALVIQDEEEARQLVRARLDHARGADLPREVGIALTADGILTGGDRGLAELREAVEVLSGTPARLEHGRALVELGAALRRCNQRAASRDPLRAGLDLAEQCGATRLAERARTELAASGARPRRARISERDALTPSEDRIARMAGDGMTNREIAQALFVTPKTVENQLGRAYRKLGIRSRDDLQEQLARESQG